MVRVITAVRLSLLSALAALLLKEQASAPATLPPPASGKKLVSLIEQFNFTEDDAADLDRVIAAHRQKVRE